MQDLSCLHSCADCNKRAGKRIRELAAVQSRTVVMMRFGTVCSSHQSDAQYVSSLSRSLVGSILEFSISDAKHLHCRFQVDVSFFKTFSCRKHIKMNHLNRAGTFSSPGVTANLTASDKLAVCKSQLN